MSKDRIATEKATGFRYRVQRIDLRADEVWCWGEVLSRRGAATKHGPSKSFPRSAVDVTETTWTEDLAKALFDQTRDRLIATGARFRGSPHAKNATVENLGAALRRMS